MNTTMTPADRKQLDEMLELQRLATKFHHCVIAGDWSGADSIFPEFKALIDAHKRAPSDVAQGLSEIGYSLRSAHDSLHEHGSRHDAHSAALAELQQDVQAIRADVRDVAA